ncbi:MAG: ABC transporter ATP-binding protein [Firmicutes bacterium HGW-Firmicutes-17]|jgi:putative ABC transport system permease protein|nr:MAG: ABC transporter ATP-binding protein [Firmicutes bacterium HGW-Firmicutes-17]
MAAQEISSYALLYLLVFIIPIVIINYKMGIGLNKRLIYALFRMTIQLILVGLFLQYIFILNNPWINSAYIFFMIGAAGISTVKTCGLTMKNQLIPIALGFGVPNFIMILFINQFIIGLDNVFNAQYYIPLMGMLLGNSLSGNIIGINTFYSGLKQNEREYHYRLALSANQWESTLPWYKEAITACMNPMIASVETIGLVSLPGMMTGQILSGSMPMTTIAYQIVIMAGILITRYFGIHFSIILTRRKAFDAYDRLKI